MRALKPEELRWVSGGYDSATPVITVVAPPHDSPPPDNGSGWPPPDNPPDYTPNFPPEPSSGGGGGSPPPAPVPYTADDHVGNHTVHISLNHQPTASEAKAIADLEAAIGRGDTAVNNLDSNKHITVNLGDGSTRDVSGAELKQEWNSTKFVVTDDPNFANQSGRGESNPHSPDNNGNPETTYNMQSTLDTTYDTEKGMDYLILHELGHATQAGQDANHDYYDLHTLTNAQNEQVANDIARAIENAEGMPILDADATHTYSPGAPLTFQ